MPRSVVPLSPILLPLLALLASTTALADGGAAAGVALPVPLPIALLGRLHFPLLHFPIALLVVVVFVELFGGTRLQAERKKDTAVALLTLGAVAAVITAVSGLAYAQGEDFTGAQATTFQLHRAVGLGTAALAVVLAALRRSPDGAPAARAYRPLLVVGALAVLVTGHFGGELVHGEGFLTKPLRRGAPTTTPPSTSPTTDDEPRVASDGDEGAGTPEARTRHPEVALVDKPDYATHVRPIFERSCVKCHGAEKRKGGLRLDQKRFALKGGESGAVIVPGDSGKSLVFTACSAPPDDEEVMPPKGKLLALSEIELLKRWIDQGAAWPDEPR